VAVAVVEGGDLVPEEVVSSTLEEVVSSTLEEVVSSSFVGACVCSGGGEEEEGEGAAVLGE
jgi:hypothetical protein